MSLMHGGTEHLLLLPYGADQLLLVLLPCLLVLLACLLLRLAGGAEQVLLLPCGTETLLTITDSLHYEV